MSCKIVSQRNILPEDGYEDIGDLYNVLRKELPSVWNMNLGNVITIRCNERADFGTTRIYRKDGKIYLVKSWVDKFCVSQVHYVKIEIPLENIIKIVCYCIVWGIPYYFQSNIIGPECTDSIKIGGKEYMFLEKTETT